MNFSELSKSKNIVFYALLQMKNLNAKRINFIIHLFSLFLSIKGRMNFLQFERFGKYDEQTYRNNFEKEFPFLEFNKNVIKEYCSANLAIAFDPSFISKSGKKTPGTGYFWSGCAGKTKWGLEIAGLAAIDCENHSAFHLEAIQTIDLKEDETLVQHYLNIVLERKKELQELSKNILVDAYFSKCTFVNPLVKERFTIISRLRDDANLRYNFDGEQKSGKGRPRKYEGKIDFKNLNLSKVKKVSCEEKEEIFTGFVFSKSLKMIINLVIVKTKKNEKWTHKLYFSTNLEQNWRLILDLYKSRFQIEFLYRDAKQFTGLNDCEARSENKLKFHFNASLTTINLAKIAHWLSVPKEGRGAFSMADVKTIYHNGLLIDRFIRKFGINPNTTKNKLKLQQLYCFGRIAA